MVREEGDSRQACSLLAQARASARTLRPILELVLGETQAEELLQFEVQNILGFTTANVEGIAAGEVFWGGDRGAADKLARRLEEWAERVDLLTAARAERAKLDQQAPMPANSRALGPATGPPRDRLSDEGHAETAPAPDIPPFDSQSGEWCTARIAAQIENLKAATLGTYRRKPMAQYVSKDKMSGEDRDGRLWRRTGTPGSHPWYYRPSLRAPTEQRS